MNDDEALRLVVEGTVAETGAEFFRALVKNLAAVMDTRGAWVTEYLPKVNRLRALAFWMKDGFVENYEYDLAGTACETVVANRKLIHIPERMIGADPVYYLRHKLGSWGTGTAHFDPRAMAEYERCFRDPATIRATCEDYRAAASIDLAHDAEDADRRVECPLLVLWGEKGVVNRLFDPLADWRAVAGEVSGRALPCGHYLAEEQPDATLEEFERFFGR